MAKKKRTQKDVGGRAFGAVVAIVFGVSISRGINPLEYISPLAIVALVAIVVLLIISVLIVKHKQRKANLNTRSNGRAASKRNALTGGGVRISARPEHPATPPIDTSRWSADLIASMEWRVFEKLCVRLWNLKGFMAKETRSGADNGVDLYLYANSTKQKIGAVQCKSWANRPIGVQVVRELQGVIASEGLQLGLLMYSGKLSQAAVDFIQQANVNVKAQGHAQIYADILKLDPKVQERLLKDLTSEDFLTPSCPQCDIKLIRRARHKSGTTFWGCPNFPKCRYVMR